MKAVVLAGGKGTRLMPYTAVLPKALVPVGDRPILDIVVRQLAHHGFRDVVLSVGHLGALIEAYLGNARWDAAGVRLSFARESEPLGTAGSLGLVPGLDETFLAMNGDVLTSLDYRKAVAFHRQQGSVLTVCVCERRQRIEQGVVSVDPEGRLIDYVEKPELRHLVSMGVYVYEPAALRHVVRGQYLDVPELVRRLLDHGDRVMGYRCEEYWVDLGQPRDYAQACEEFERRRRALLPWEAGSGEPGHAGPGPAADR